MRNTLLIFLLFIAISVLPKLFSRVRLWLALTEIRFVKPTIKPFPSQDIPAHYIPIFNFAREQIESKLDFRFRGTAQTLHELPDSLLAIQDIYVSPDGLTIAAISFNFYPSSYPFRVTYFSLAESGEQIETIDLSEHLYFYAMSELHDAECDDFEVQYQTHQQRLQEAQSDRQLKLMDCSHYELATILPLLQADLDLQHEALLESKALRDLPEQGSFRYTSSFAWEMSARMMQGQKDVALKHEQLSQTPLIEHQAYSAEAETAEFHWFEEVKEVVSSRRRFSTKLLILLVSAILFFAVFGLWLGALNSLLLLVIVFFHELGHISAMALFGYRNRQVLFIPFFGAAAYGEKNEAPAWQQLVVLFMGPIPGIIVGLLMLWFGFSNMDQPAPGDLRRSMLFMVAAMTLFLNYINLLPIGFLDGGKIVQILFLSRLPRAQFCFQVLSALAFVIFAIWQRSMLLAIIAFFSVAALPSQWRFGSLIKRLKSSFNKTFGDQDSTNHQKRVAVFSLLREPPFERLSPQNRQNMAIQLIRYVETSKAGLSTIIIGSAIYLLSAVLPVLLVLMWISLIR